MWEQVKRFSRGRISARRFSLLVTSGLLTFFMAAFAFTTPVYADTAERSGGDLVYQGQIYKKAVKSSDPATNELPPDVVAASSNTEGYRYAQPQTKKVHFILVTGDAAAATSGYYVVYDFNPPNSYTNGTVPVEVTINGGADQNQDEQPDQVNACDGTGSLLTGVGWFICPMVNFIAKSMDKIYQVIASYLAVTTVTADTNSPLYQLWKIIRDIANICFVIAIIVIIYSQLTSIGISNYGIKNTLPRIIIAAILVNISYWICAVAVDASNILGYAIHSMFTGLMERFSVGSNYAGLMPTWEEVSAVALAGTAAAAVAGWSLIGASIPGSLALLIPLLLSAVIAALVALLVLAARQALITIFIIISPLAFVAYVLPNTEKYFTKWREAFTTLLLLFPIFSVVFSGAQLAGMAIIQSSGGNLFTIILGLGVQVAPIVVTPLLVKFSGSLIGRVAGILNNPNKELIDRTRNWAQGVASDQRNKILSDQNRTSRLNNKRWNPNNWTKAVNNRRRFVEGRRKAWEGAADNAFAGNRFGQRIEKMNRENANEKKRVDNRWADSYDGRRLEVESRHLDVNKQNIENSMLRSQEGQRLTRRQQLTEIDKTRVQNEFEESHFGHEVDKAKRTVELEKNKIHNEHQASWDNLRRTDPGVLELELGVKSSELKASAAKAKLEKMHAEIAAQGIGSEHILNLRGVDVQTQAGMLNIAHDINLSQVETSLAGMAKSAAEHELSSKTNDILLKNTIQVDGVDVRKYAAGIGSQDAVLASSVARERKEFAEDVAHQKELSSHFKLNAGQIEKLAMGREDVEIKDENGNIVHVFKTNDEYVRDMAVEEIFTVGSHGQKMAVLKSVGKGDINFDNRRTIQQAAIKSGISNIAPAINDKTLDDIINGRFSGDESWQYHSFREVLEGRIKANTLSTTNAASLEVLFADVNDSTLTRTQFDKLVDDGISGELEVLRVANPSATEADARASILARYDKERDYLRKMAVQVLDTPTIRQNANAQSIEVLKKFAGSLYSGD